MSPSMGPEVSGGTTEVRLTWLLIVLVPRRFSGFH
jgi:hypothetical protein